MKATSNVYTTTVVLIGDADIRFQARHALAAMPGVVIVGELAALAPRHLRVIEELNPQTVVLDCGATEIDAFRVLAEMRGLACRPHIIAVDSTESGKVAELLGYGATSVVTTRHELQTAIMPTIAPLTPVATLEHAA